MAPEEHDDEDLTEEQHLTNPSGRLLLLFRYLRHESGASTNQSPIPVRTLVARYLGIEENNNAAYFVGFAGLVQLPVQARAQIASLDRPAIPKRTLIRPFDMVETVLPQAATSRTRAHDFAASVGDNVLDNLETASAILRHHSATRAVEPPTLERLRRLATEIIDDLAASEIPAAIREALHLHAQAIVDAINLYKVHGGDALARQMDGLTGAVVRNAPGIPGFLNNPIVQKISALGNAITAATVILGTPAAIAGGIDFLHEITSSETVIVNEAPPAQDVNGEETGSGAREMV